MNPKSSFDQYLCFLVVGKGLFLSFIVLGMSEHPLPGELAEKFYSDIISTIETWANSGVVGDEFIPIQLSFDIAALDLDRLLPVAEKCGMRLKVHA